MSKRHEFEKGHPWRFKAQGDEPLTAPLTIKLTEKQREHIKKVPDWQGLLRSCIDNIIKENYSGT
ncbi:MAG: hypothetical protein AAFQ23_10865 [Cyanobacteria bacterium J06623_1]